MTNRKCAVFTIYPLYCLICLVWAAPTLFAATPLEAYVPAGYDLTARANVRQAMDLPSLEPFRSRLLTPQMRLKLDQVTTITGLNVLADIDQALVAGNFDPAKKPDGLVILQGRLNKARIIGFLQRSPQYEETTVGNRKVMGFWSENEKELRYVTFLDDSTLALGRRAPIEGSIKAIGATSGRLMDVSEYKTRLQAIAGDPLLAVVAVIPAQSASNEPTKAALLRSIKSISAIITAGDVLTDNIEISAIDAAKAQQGRDVLQGIVSFALLTDRFPQLTSAAQKAKIQSTGSMISANLRLTVDEARRLLALVPGMHALGDNPPAQ